MCGLFAALFGCPKPRDFSCEPGPTDAGAGADELLPTALINGFQVTQFQLQRDVQPGSFLVVLPRRSEVLTCAVFVANPRFDEEHSRIANAPEVIARYQLFSIDGRTPTLSFALAAFERPTSSSFKSCNQPPSRYRVEGLSLGCWAMDGTQLVGATRLLELALTDLPQALPPVESCLRADLTETAGRLCSLDAQFGVCSQGACLPGNSDAGDPPGVTLAECSLESTDQPCVLSQPTQLGRCRSGLCVGEPDAEIPADQLVISCSDTGAQRRAVRDGFSCLQGELGTFGTCYQARCRRRCVDDESCKPPSGDFRGQLSEETTCAGALEGAKVKVCMRAQEAP